MADQLTILEAVDMLRDGETLTVSRKLGRLLAKVERVDLVERRVYSIDRLIPIDVARAANLDIVRFEIDVMLTTFRADRPAPTPQDPTT
jgi:hypothetical protein